MLNVVEWFWAIVLKVFVAHGWVFCGSEAIWLRAWLRCWIGKERGVVCGGGVGDGVWVVSCEDVLLGGGEGKMTAEARFAL